MEQKETTRSIKLLGSLEIQEDGQPSKVMKRAKGCALVAYLIVTGQRQRREVVADLLWEVQSTEQSLKNLRTLLPRIRPFLPELIITRTTIAFQPTSNLFVDFTMLKNALMSDDLSRLDQALKLYKGCLLEEFYLKDAPRFNEWLLVAREQLRIEVVAGFRRLCQSYHEQKQWRKGIAAAQRWVGLDSWDEEALRWLMQLLVADGQVMVALQQYQTCRQQLWQELAVEPESATQAFAHQLEGLKEELGDVSLSVSDMELPDSSQPASPSSLPANSTMPFHRNPDFTGRQADLLFLAKRLLPWPNPTDLHPRAVVLSGMGGMGKTQLGVEFAYRYGRYFPGGVHWFSFAQADNVAEEIAAVGGERGMGLFQEADHLTLADKLGRIQRVWQEPVPRLLIFDNCEDETLLAKWLPVTGGCRVLLTSRRAAWSRELDLAILPLSVLTQSEGGRLLHRLAPDMAKGVADEIAAEVGCLPLALHLAGSFMARYRQISPVNYLAQLRDQSLLQHPSLQGRGVDFSPTGHELHVSRTFAINMEQIDPASETGATARKLLARAACFSPGEPFPKHLLQAAVVDDKQNLMAIILAEDGLTQLIKLGFLVLEEREMIVMHPLLAAFAAEFLADDMLAAWADVGKSLLQALQAQKERGEFHYSLPLSPSHLQTVIEAPQTEATVAVPLGNVLGRHLQDLGDYEHARPFHERALKLSQEALGLNHLETAECLDGLGGLCWNVGDFNAARTCWEQALAIHRTLGLSCVDTGLLLKHLGVLSSRLGEYVVAQSYYEQALAVIESLSVSEHSSTAAALILNNMGELHLQMGEWEAARPFLERSLSIVEMRLGANHPLTAACLNNLGRLFSDSGEVEAALSYLKRALNIFEESLGAEHPDTAKSLHALGDLHLRMGEWEAARPFLERTLAIREKGLGCEHVDTARSLISLGELHRTIGDEVAALSFNKRALAVLETAVAPNHPDIQRIHQNLAMIEIG